MNTSLTPVTDVVFLLHNFIRFIKIHAREATTMSSSIRWRKDRRTLDMTGAIYQICRFEAPRAAGQSTVDFAASPAPYSPLLLAARREQLNQRRVLREGRYLLFSLASYVISWLQSRGFMAPYCSLQTSTHLVFSFHNRQVNGKLEMCA